VRDHIYEKEYLLLVFLSSVTHALLVGIIVRHSGERPESRKEELVPDFRLDDVWTPAFAGVTGENLRPYL